MRDLLYLSETKVQMLSGQLRGRVRKRLGLEAGVNAGFASLKATLAPDGRPATLDVLDAVVRMIERDRGLKRHTDPDLRPGHWVRFEEDFRYGTAHHACPSEASELVYFPAVVIEPSFLLVGSAAHVTDRRHTPAETTLDSRTPYYAEAVHLFVQRVRFSHDDGAAEDVEHYSGTPLPPWMHTGRQGDLRYGISWLCGVEAGRDPHFVGPVLLSGMARILAVERGAGERRCILATPLFLEYAPY